MFKKFLVLLIVLGLLTLQLPVPTYAVGEENVGFNQTEVTKLTKSTKIDSITAPSYILVDARTGAILAEKNTHEKRAIASVTKIMSMLLVMEAIDSGKISLDTICTISDYVYQIAIIPNNSAVYLAPGEQFTVEELLKAVAVHSANDATVALAEKISGSENIFVEEMNRRAKELGMNDTHFRDCTGLSDDDHYSSAYDIAVLARELVTKHPDIKKYTTIWHDMFRTNSPGKQPFSLDNTNKLLKLYPGTTGLKTGFTAKAGFCLCATVERNDTSLISVVLGSSSLNTRCSDTIVLMDYGFANFEQCKFGVKGDAVGEAKIYRGENPTVKALLNDDASILVNKSDKEKVKTELKFSDDLSAPITAGQKLGHVVYSVDGKEIAKVEIVAQDDVKQASWWTMLIRTIKEWLGIE